MSRHNTAFYLETMLLVGLMVAVIIVLVGVFGGAKSQSLRAVQLTDAVTIAENAAEAVAASDSMEEARALLDDSGDSEIIDGETRVLLIHKDGYDVSIPDTWGGELVPGLITVSRDGEEIYSLETTVYRAQEAEG